MRMCIAALTAFALSACATVSIPEPQMLSGPVTEDPVTADGLVIGFVADSQLQTRTNYARVPFYRGWIEDAFVRVAMRPPALDWASRAILKTHLAQLKRDGAKAIFYLGDAANNGCFDELLAGYDPAGRRPTGENDRGMLAILDEFRSSNQIPVYFVLGNHDMLGAGSTSKDVARTTFCSSGASWNRPLAKSEVIGWVDRFNRQNERFAPGWTYTSNYVAGTTEKLCGGRFSRQYRTWGCYLAARLDTNASGTPVQFLLLDTNDWADIKHLSIGPIQQLGKWGGMSIGPPRDRVLAKGEPPERVMSQIDWLTTNASNHVPMRVALMHYNVVNLQKRVGPFPALSHLSKRMMDLFAGPGSPRSKFRRQDGAYFISAHTHDPVAQHEPPQEFRVGCGAPNCRSREFLHVTELNIGSTTDDSNYSVLAELRPMRGAPGEIRFKRVDVDKAACAPVYADIERHVFPQPLGGNSRGWAAVGVFPGDRHNYWTYKLADAQIAWDNLDEFADGDVAKATCIGLRAAAIEARKYP